MAERNRVIDYIIEQADRYDIKNLQFEDDLKFQLKRLTDRYNTMAINKVIYNIESVYSLTKLINSIEKVIKEYVSQCEKIMLDKFTEYYKIAYDNTGDLIDLGNEIQAKFNQGVSEQKANREYDEDTIQYIQEHAFELLKGHSYQKIEKLRAELGNLFLQGRANKANVRDLVQKILEVNKGKAEEIAQTELSRAYNFGTLKRLHDYQNMTGQRVRKYWHGFKYSDRTCEYCRPRIGQVYDLDDYSEELPAHVRCRCVWIPILDGWDKPFNPKKMLSRANILNTAYNKDMMYTRINNRLGINYAEYMSEESMSDYLVGERSQKIQDELNNARNQYIKDKSDSFNIARDNSRSHMSNEFNQQMDFWKRTVAGAMADNNVDLLNRSYDSIQGLMVMPWSAEQLSKWNDLLAIIRNYK